jgi:hypothetical protein
MVGTQQSVSVSYAQPPQEVTRRGSDISIIAETNQHAKPVITTTQMLWSMVNAPRPTRAKAADIANAAIDGTDALMLSEETAIGRYPVQAEALAAMARETEHTKLPLGTRGQRIEDLIPSEAECMAQAACHIASTLKLEAIVTVTLEGTSARLVAKYRPVQPILAAMPRVDTYRRLALIRGVTPLLLSPDITTREGITEEKSQRRQKNSCESLATKAEQSLSSLAFLPGIICCSLTRYKRGKAGLTTDIGSLLSENGKYSPHSGSSVLVWKNLRRHGGVVDELSLDGDKRPCRKRVRRAVSGALTQRY